MVLGTHPTLRGAHRKDRAQGYNGLCNGEDLESLGDSRCLDTRKSSNISTSVGNRSSAGVSVRVHA